MVLQEFIGVVVSMVQAETMMEMLWRWSFWVVID
uniref:Uncharacterized protein n=1 Tax=Manihot esculenta TaxID=3983 RepID=A0A2C9UGQ3_MANES